MRVDTIIDPVTNKTRDGAYHELFSLSDYAIFKIK